MRAEIEKIAIAWASYFHFAFPIMSCKFSVTQATLQSPIKKYFLVFIDFQQMIMCTYYGTYIALNFFNHQITSFWSWNFKLITFLPLSFIEWVTIHFYLDWKLSYIFTHLKYIRLKLSTSQPYHRIFENYDIEFLFSSINVKLSAWTKCAVFCTVHVYCKFYSRTSLIYKIQTLITFVK